MGAMKRIFTEIRDSPEFHEANEEDRQQILQKWTDTKAYKAAKERSKNAINNNKRSG